MSITNLRLEIADADYDCNACTLIKDCLDDILPQLTEEQKIAVELAQKNNWQVKKGEQCRRYMWNEGGEEETDCVEIVAMAEICLDLDLYP